MADKSTKDCLLAAVDALTVERVDAEELARIKRRLRNYIKNSRMEGEDLVMSLQHQAEAVRQDLIADRMAEEGHAKRMADYSSGRYDVEAAGTIKAAAAVANRMRRSVSWLWGNRGDREETTLDGMMQFEANMLAGKLAPVVRFVSDSTGLVRDSEMAMPWLKEVLGIDTGNAEAKAMAKVFHDTTFEYVNRLRKAGVWVEKIANWFPQTHDWAEIQKDVAGWRNFLLQHLDPERHPDREAAIDALQHAVAEQEYAGETPGKLGMGRTFWMSTPEAQLEYQLRFGRGNVTSTVLSTIHRFASSVALAEKYGPKPVKLMEERGEQIARNIAARPAKSRADEKLKATAQRDLERARNLIQSQQQAMSTPTLRDLENTLLALRETFSAIFLGKVTLSMIPEDTWMSVWQGRLMSGGVLQSVADRFRAFADVATNHADMRDIAEGFGYYQYAVTANGSTSRFSMAAGPDAPLDVTSGKWSDRAVAFGQQARIATNRVVLASLLEQGLRGANGMANLRGLARHLQVGWADLDPRLRTGVFKANGLTARDWARLQALHDPANPIFDLRALEKKDLALFRKLGAALVRESKLQTIMPDLESRYLVTGMIPPGVPRQAAQIMTQFLAWPTTVWRNAVGRDLRSGTPDFLIGSSGYVVMAAFKIQLYALAAGGIANTFEWDSPTLWRRALGMSAVAGPWLPMLFDAVGEGQLEMPGIVPSRVIGSAAQLLSIGKDLMDDETDKAAARAVREIGQYVPNWWFLDGVTNHLVNSIVEDLDPAAARRAARRAEEEGRRGD